MRYCCFCILQYKRYYSPKYRRLWNIEIRATRWSLLCVALVSIFYNLPYFGIIIALVLQNAEAAKTHQLYIDFKGVPAQQNFTAEAILEVISGRLKSDQNTRYNWYSYRTVKTHSLLLTWVGYWSSIENGWLPCPLSLHSMPSSATTTQLSWRHSLP